MTARRRVLPPDPLAILGQFVRGSNRPAFEPADDTTELACIELGLVADLEWVAARMAHSAAREAVLRVVDHAKLFDQNMKRLLKTASRQDKFIGEQASKIEELKDAILRQEGYLQDQENNISELEAQIERVRENKAREVEVAVLDAAYQEHIDELRAELEVISERTEAHDQEMIDYASSVHDELNHDGTFVACSLLICRRAQNLLDDWLECGWYADEQGPVDAAIAKKLKRGIFSENSKEERKNMPKTVQIPKKKPSGNYQVGRAEKRQKERVPHVQHQR